MLDSETEKPPFAFALHVANKGLSAMRFILIDSSINLLSINIHVMLLPRFIIIPLHAALWRSRSPFHSLVSLQTTDRLNTLRSWLLRNCQHQMPSSLENESAPVQDLSANGLKPLNSGVPTHDPRLCKDPVLDWWPVKPACLVSFAGFMDFILPSSPGKQTKKL